ncbi:helix-turn-helix transcriptional regulator [Shewanella sp. D64]|uniref:helix-turn-helix transcriptional regulator n=1 Tax=unclassified Shewanella TaxID=196818 RepID=UPI0022BA5F50|nr:MULTISPECIES: helix-turn-helix transcriptional regulator [unclassified Shewanella]MEC4728735.1 helix-turn-helix transcriptional regulator [Shewanella sp. D64]MEC4740604.1 helix-turn-helix transcriptional regulator [Shewanella sp. E94]WBJ95119.1 helix-turn-helix transcriptional regulator [Shewanella sp. MTB7]
MPNEFLNVLNLDDNDLISMKMVTKGLEYIEQHSNNENFYMEFIPVIENRWINFFNSHVKESFTQAERIVNLYKVYPGRMASVNWELKETDTNLSLVARRTSEKSCSKFDDLNLYNFASKILNDSKLDELNPISVSLPFNRRFYGKYTNIFHNVSFDAIDMSITVKKTNEEIESKKIFKVKKCEVGVYFKMIGAANMIPIHNLDLSSLSFILGLSTRSLQRTLKDSGLSASNIIRDVRFNHARRNFLKNNYNIKKTSLECGFKEQGQLTKLFFETSGMTPSQYKQLIGK